MTISENEGNERNFDNFTFIFNARSLVDFALRIETAEYIWVQGKLREGFSILFFELPCTGTLISH